MYSLALIYLLRVLTDKHPHVMIWTMKMLWQRSDCWITNCEQGIVQIYDSPSDNNIWCWILIYNTIYVLQYNICIKLIFLCFNVLYYLIVFLLLYCIILSYYLIRYISMLRPWRSFGATIWSEDIKWVNITCTCGVCARFTAGRQT